MNLSPKATAAALEADVVGVDDLAEEAFDAGADDQKDDEKRKDTRKAGFFSKRFSK